MGTYTLSIVGESHYQDAIRRCRQGGRVILKREPENPYDENAVAVLREDGEKIGYLTRDNAVWVAEIMDEARQVEAKIERITGGTKDKPTRGVVIDVDTTPLRTEKPQAEAGGFWKSLFGRRSPKIEGEIGYFGLPSGGLRRSRRPNVSISIPRVLLPKGPSSIHRERQPHACQGLRLISTSPTSDESLG